MNIFAWWRKPTRAMKIAQQLQDAELHLLDLEMAREHFSFECVKHKERIARLQSELHESGEDGSRAEAIKRGYRPNNFGFPVAVENMEA